MEHVHIHVSNRPGERVRINFGNAADALEFLRFINSANRAVKTLRLSSVYSVLDIPTPSIFADRKFLGWITPVDYTLYVGGLTTTVYLDQPINWTMPYNGGEIMNLTKLLSSDEWNQYSTVSDSGRYWKHLEKSEPEPEVPYPTKVIRSGPMTIAVWPDKSKTYVRIKDDDMSQDDPEKALALVTLKKLLGPHKFRKLFKEFLSKKES